MCGLILRARSTTKTSRFRPVRVDVLIGAVAASTQSKGITMAIIAKATRRDMHEYVSRLEPFTYHKSASAEWTTGKSVSSGMLSYTLMSALEKFIGNAEREVYVVYSYATPIAVYVEGLGWWINPEKYSPTTTQHQYMTRNGIRTYMGA